MAEMFTAVRGRSKAKDYPVARTTTVYFKAIIQGFLLDSSYMTLLKIYNICCIYWNMYMLNQKKRTIKHILWKGKKNQQWEQF